MEYNIIINSSTLPTVLPAQVPMVCTVPVENTGLIDDQGQYIYTAWVPAATPGISTTITRWEKLNDMSTEVLTATGIWNDRLTLNYS